MTFATSPVAYNNGVRLEMSDAQYRTWLIGQGLLRTVEQRWEHKGLLPVDFRGREAAVRHIAEFRRHDAAMQRDPNLPEIAIPEDQLAEFFA